MGLAVGGAYLAVATGSGHLVDELGVARHYTPVDRTGGGSVTASSAALAGHSGLVWIRIGAAAAVERDTPAWQCTSK